MDLLGYADERAYWNGYEYYKEGRVLGWTEAGDGTYSGTVRGSEGEAYAVTVDGADPRKSRCSCPHAARPGRIVCKHQVALFFAVFPEKAAELDAILEGIRSERRMSAEQSENPGVGEK